MCHRFLIALTIVLCSASALQAQNNWTELLDRADSLSEAGQYDSAIIIGKLALERVTSLFGPESIPTSKVLSSLGQSFLYSANYSQADSILHRALAIREKALGPDHPDVAESLNDIGELYHYQDQYALAEPLYKRALAIYDKTIGPERLEVAICLNNLAFLYKTQGQYAQAELLYKRALAINEKTIGPEHPEVATNLNNLASLYTTQGLYTQAEPLCKRAIAIDEKALGLDHPELATDLFQLASLYCDQGLYTQAESLYKRALAIREKTLGPNHPDVARSLTSLGALYYAQGLYTRAESLHKRALAIFEKANGSEHTDVATALNNLAVVYKTQGQYAQAELLYKRALAISEKNIGPEHPAVAANLNNLASLYSDQGLYTQAETLYKRALVIREKAFGPNRPAVANSLNSLAVLYDTQGQYAQAEPLYKRALAIWEKALSPDHPLVGLTLNNLAFLYYNQGLYTQAETLCRRSLAIRENALGPNHPEVAKGLNILAMLYDAQGLDAQAELLFRRSLAIREKAFGPDHPEVVKVLERFGGFYRHRDRLREAEPLFWRAVEVSRKSFLNNVQVMSEPNALLYAKLLGRAVNSYLSCFTDFKRSNEKYLHASIEVVLSGKGRVSDVIFERQRSLVRESDSSTIALADTLVSTRLQLSKLFVSGPGKEGVKVFRSKLDSLTVLCNEAEAELSRLSASFRKRQELNDVTVAKVTAAMPSKAVLLEYMRFDYLHIRPDTTIPHFLVAALSGDGVMGVQDLGEASGIDSLIADYRSNLLAMSQRKRLPLESDRTSYELVASKLYKRIVQPVESYLKDKGLVFLAPDGGLNLVSFAGLIDNQGKYLIENYPIHYLSSGRDLIRLQDSVTTGHGLLALGDPDFDASIGARCGTVSQPTFASADDLTDAAKRHSRRSACGDLSQLRVERVPNTRAEINRIASKWRDKGVDSVQVYFGAQASEDRIKAKASGKKVIHLATHGYFLEGHCNPEQTANRFDLDDKFVGENPLLLSGLLFAGSNLHGAGADSAGLDDGILSAYEVSSMNLQGTDLVVLSACETGLGDVKQGEGVYGLRRAFQLAGALTVVSSLWQVDDEITAEMMGRLYVKSDKSIPERMRQLQLEQINKLRAGGFSDHPYSWAAFIAQGGWR